MKIGIFGGTFDPVHKEHIKIADFAFKNLNLDKLFFVPNNINPFKEKNPLISNEQRLDMLKISIENKYEICLFEINRKYVSYTIDTVKYFKQKYSQDQLFLIIGSDNLKKINKWKNIDQISELTQLVVYRRNKGINKTNLKKYNGILLKNDLSDFSSTKYKEGQINLVDQKVQEYIANNFLYLENIAKNWLSNQRFIHCKHTANLAREYAKSLKMNAQDCQKAYIAGLMHDLTKEWTIEEHHNLLKKYQVDYTNIPNFDLHGKTASLWLEKEFLMKDLDVLNSIKNHTLLHEDLSIFDKIIFAADKLCQNRKWPNIQKVRNLILQDFEKGFKELLINNLNLIKQSKKSLSEESLKIYDKLINQ